MTDADQEERELRILLQQAVPHLPTPVDRMQRIRERAARTRRRRRAVILGGGLAGCLAAALAFSPLLHPPPTVRDTPQEPAASITAPTLLPKAGKTIGYPDLGGFSIHVPDTWTGNIAFNQSTAEVIGYVRSTALATVQSCLPPGNHCKPKRVLAPGAALLTFVQVDKQRVVAKNSNYAEIHVVPPDQTCAPLGGDTQLNVWRPADTSEPGVLVFITACLRSPDQAQLAQVRETLNSTNGSGATPGAVTDAPTDDTLY